MSLGRSVNELDNYQVIRKLGDYESLYDYEVINGNFYLTRALLVNLKTGDINLDLVKKACHFWCIRNPLLKSQIFRADSKKYERYFVKFKDEERFNRFDNVEFMETNDELKWKKVMDREIINPFDMGFDPLWRLKVIKIIDKTDLGYNYAFVFTSQHAIGDGRSMFTLCVQLLNIIGKLIENKTCPEMETVGVSEFSAEDLIKQKNFVFGEAPVDNHFDDIVRRPECLGDKINGQQGKMEYFSISSDKLKQVLKRMKEKSKIAKLTGVLTAVFALAQKIVQERHNCSIDSKRYQFVFLASVREKLGIDNTYNGVYSSGLEQSIECDLNFENLWDFAEKQTTGLHEMIHKNVDIKHFEYTDESFETLIANKYDESVLNAVISNLGIMNNTQSDLIHVVEHYLRMSAIYGRIGSTAFNAITTIDGKLFWAITYNEKYFRQNIILEIIQEMKSLIDKIIE